MKKLFALVLALMMLFSLSVTALADDEGQEPLTLSWETARAAFNENNISGKFYSLESDVDVWVPDMLVLQDETPENTYAYFMTDGQTADLRVIRYDVDENFDLVAYMKQVEENGSEKAALYWINGYYGVIFADEKQDTINLMLEVGDGTATEFVFCPASSADYSTLAGLIMATIQPREVTLDLAANMIDADLLAKWGENRHVTFTEATNEVFVSIWDEGVTEETIQDVNNWDSVKEYVVESCAGYCQSLPELGLNDASVMMQYCSEDESTAFLTVENGEVTYDVFEG